MLQLKNQRSRSKNVCFFYYFDFERNYDVLHSKNPCFLLKKSTNLRKNERESKMENPTHTLRETNLVLHPIWESWIRSKTVMSWSLQKEKEEIFFEHSCFVKMFSVLNNTNNIQTSTCQKKLLHTLFCLFL